MAEAPDRQLTAVDTAATRRRSPTIPEVQADMRETRERLAVEIARTTDRLDSLFRRPSESGSEDPPQETGVLGIAVGSIAAFHKTKRAWEHAKSDRVVRKASLAAAVIAVAALVAVGRRWRRRRQ
jgi:hypothetical protein